MQCQVEVDVFSGRPNPSWSLPEGVHASLMSMWDEASPCPPGLIHESRLGYRGITLVCDDGSQFDAFEGKICYSHDSSSEWRVDADRGFEKTLLTSAPADLLPTGLLDL